MSKDDVKVDKQTFITFCVLFKQYILNIHEREQQTQNKNQIKSKQQTRFYVVKHMMNISCLFALLYLSHHRQFISVSVLV